ncbi:MAG TPA: hypothetical protein VM054_01720 [bacterium]|nr:hypothetical protein [bacterium]
MPSFDDVPIKKGGEVVAQAMGMGPRVVFRCVNSNCYAQLLFNAAEEEAGVGICQGCGAQYRLTLSPDDGRIVGLEML